MIHPVNNDTGREAYCGPRAIAALTGLPVSAIEARIRRGRGGGYRDRMGRKIPIKGTYDDAFDLCGWAAAEYGWYNRSTGVNPFTREGKKTAAYELCEQLGWDVPDVTAAKWQWTTVGAETGI